MPAAEGNPAAPAQGRQQEQGGRSMVYKILQAVAMWYGMNLVTKQLFGKGNQGSTTAEIKNADGTVVKVANTGPIPPYDLRPAQLDEGAIHNPMPQRLAPIWSDDKKVDIIVTISDTPYPAKISQTPEQYRILSERNFQLGNFSEKRVVEATFDVPKAVQNNGTLWGHFFFGLAGSNLDPQEPDFNPGAATYFAYPLTQYVPKKKEKKMRNLLGSKVTSETENDESQQEDASTGPAIASYYHPNTSLAFIPGTGILDLPKLQGVGRHFLHVEPTGARDGSGQNSWYYPILFVNTFWQLKSHMTLLNDTVTTLPIRIDLGNMRNWQFNLIGNVELNSREQARQAAYGKPVSGGGDGSEIEMVKQIFLDTNPYLLGVTAVVSVAHMVLEMLAFGSDIAHYRKKKDNVGISVRSILANVFMQAVIFLYLVDQSQNTSWMILASQGIGILIEFWKITTVVDVRVRPSRPGAWLPYAIVFEDKYKLSETEEKTKQYDEIAFKYMYIAGIPLLVAYAAYSLVYESHKSWYSFVIATLVGSVYAYGFLMMVPSLYINYRLQSVAHMPGKAMMYKFLNTFIDDLFAFAIKMPILHRLATFRDDVIFFVYLWQRWAYRIDYSRVNEFGQGGGDEDDEGGNKKKLEEKEGGEEDEEVEGEVVSETMAARVTGTETGGKKATRRK